MRNNSEKNTTEQMKSQSKQGKDLKIYKGWKCCPLFIVYLVREEEKHFRM
jgi:hypothetical protein